MTYYDDKAATINTLVQAIEAIKTELGLMPAGAYATVRTRLDILEARINNPFAPSPNALNPFYIGNTGVSIQTSFGDPNILDVLAISGSLYLREDGYNDDGLYTMRPDGYWHQIDTDPWTAAGDLSGNIYSQTVIGIQGRPVNQAAPQTDSEGDGYVLTWNESLAWWEPQIGFFAAGDLEGSKISQTVVNLQGNKISVASPNDAQVITWNVTLAQWEPQNPAVIWTPTDNPSSQTNIVGNRGAAQSPTDSTQTGVVNLGSRSIGVSTGVTASYASILSGDQNQVGGIFSTVSGGSNNTIVDSQASVIVGGVLNTITALDEGTSFIGGGNNNTIDGYYGSVIVGGDQNYAQGIVNFIGNGDGNQIYGQFSSIINGQNNSISTSTTWTNQVGCVILIGDHQTIQDSNGTSLLGGRENTTINTQFSTIINGDYNILGSGSNFSSYETIISGNENSLYGKGDTVIGFSNTIDYTSTLNLVVGDLNSLTGSAYGTVFGSTNTLNTDGYALVVGYDNQLSGNYNNIFGDHNFVANTNSYVNVWGSANTLNSSKFSAVFGYDNSIASLHGTVWGSSNTIASGANHGSIFGSNNIINTGSTHTYIFGNSNTITGNFAGAFGSHHSVGANYTFVDGYFGKAINFGQYTHAANNFDGATSGQSQFSRMLLNGSAASGAAIALTLDGADNVVTESGKCYDMEVRILLTDTTTAGICARYVFGVLAHNESSTLVIDRLDAVLLNDNGTSWVGNNWTGVISASGSNLIISIPNASGSTYPSDSRRAVATVEWRELTRM